MKAKHFLGATMALLGADNPLLDYRPKFRERDLRSDQTSNRLLKEAEEKRARKAAKRLSNAKSSGQD